MLLSVVATAHCPRVAALSWICRTDCQDFPVDIQQASTGLLGGAGNCSNCSERLEA